MQLIEVSVIGVRSAVTTVRRRDTPLRFVLFPMIHLGTPAFYEAVTARLRECQVIVAEGVGGRSLFTRALTASYRTPARSKRLGLAVQDIDVRELAAAGIVVITPDLTADQARRGWRTVPWVQRLALLVLAPAFGIALRVIGTRRLLGRYQDVEDEPTVADLQVELAYPQLTKLITDARDQLLVDALAGLIAERSEDAIMVGVLYGAGHMSAVVRALASQGFRPRQAEWLVVFDF